jgi:hypothetical protein
MGFSFQTLNIFDRNMPFKTKRHPPAADGGSDKHISA